MLTYTYEPLCKGYIRHKQRIRLVTLLPGSGTDTIRIYINRAPFEKRSYPVYEALSYCWGDKEDCCNIEVVPLPRPRSILRRFKPGDNSPSPTSLRITSSLASALIHLRMQDTTRVLWIDAICLDQANAAETTLEMGKMGTIYKKAKSVVVWLGPGSAATANAFQAMSHLGLQVEWVAEENRVTTAKTCDRSWQDWRRESFEVPFDRGTWLAIEDVFQSQWFRRVWIWQEICLANPDSAVVQCGASSIPWRRFLNAIAFFETDPTSGAADRQANFESSIKEVANLALIPHSRHLLGLLGVTRRCSCSEPKDRIYGLLGLATHEDESRLLASLKPSETKSPSQVYKDFAAGEIDVMHRLNILSHCDAAAWNAELPTWVPAWDIKLPYKNLNLGVFAGGRGAMGPEDCLGTISNNVLNVYGVICDTLSNCSATASEAIDVLEMSSILRNWVHKPTPGAVKSWADDDDQMLTALCHTITAGYIGNRYPETRLPADSQATKAIIRYILASTQAINSSSDIPFSEVPSMINHIRDALPYRRFYLTGTGRIGLGPSHAQPGDQVVSIIGSKQLMLLRPVPLMGQQGEQFKIVGLCYQHGLMDLEAILGPLPTSHSVRLVEPCNDPWNMRFLRHGDAEAELSPHDPRLDRDHEGWKSDRRDPGDGTVIWERIGGTTGTKSDPRHTDLKFLRGRGVPVRLIRIV